MQQHQIIMDTELSYTVVLKLRLFLSNTPINLSGCQNPSSYCRIVIYNVILFGSVQMIE
jgi:hypothetical protein